MNWNLFSLIKGKSCPYSDECKSDITRAALESYRDDAKAKHKDSISKIEMLIKDLENRKKSGKTRVN